jgi:hypothetical protein
MTDSTVDAWGEAIKVADAVMFEGYLLYPYRASSDKNRMRWQFGVLAPSSVAAAIGEPSGTRTEVLCEPGTDATLRLCLRFLHLQTRTVEVPLENGFTPVDRATVAGVDYLSWEEAVERQVEASLPVANLLTAIGGVPFEIPASVEIETHDGVRLVRRCAAVTGLITVSAAELPGPFGGVRLRAVVSNTTMAVADSRPASLPTSLIGAHLLLAMSNGNFLSLTDPPEWARPATAELVNDHAWPVLVGDASRRDTMLSAPIILYDFPSIAPESPQALFDGTEIDEILTLRTMTLTDEEKRQARATDARVGELLDQIDSMPPQIMDRLHGTIRYLRQVTGDQSASEETLEPERSGIPGGDAEQPWWDPGEDSSVDPETDMVIVDGVPVSKGSRVELSPRLSGTDAQDMFLVGRRATVQAVVLDVDGTHHVAVTLDDDPGADLQTAQGRFRYFAPIELRPLSTSEAES